MVVKLKGSVIDAIEETEAKKLKLLRISSKTDGATVSLELPDALCDALNVRDTINLVIDSKPILKGEQAKLYAEGTVFKIEEEGDFEMIGTIGGLRLVLKLSKPKPIQRETFDSKRFYLALT